MKNTKKKIVMYLLIGIMQISLSGSVIEASSLYNDSPQRIVKLDDGHHDDKQRENTEQLHEENERHEREMRRHDNESDQDYRERQRRENVRHENALHDIEILLTGISIGGSIQNW